MCANLKNVQMRMGVGVMRNCAEIEKKNKKKIEGWQVFVSIPNHL